MMQEFYIANNGEAYGPVNVEETNRLWKEGRFEISTLVWDEACARWVSALDHPVLSRVVRGEYVAAANDVSTARYDVRDELQAEIDQLRAAIDRLKVDRDRLAAEVNSISSAALEARSNREAEVEARRETLASIESAVSEYRSELSQIEKQIDGKIAEGEELARTRASRLEVLQREISSLESRSAELAKAVEHREAESAEALRKAGEIDSRLAVAAARDSERREADEKEAAARAEELSRLAGLIGERRTEFNALSGRVARLKAENELLDSRRVELVRDQERLGAVIEGMKSEAAGLDSEGAKLEEIRAEKDAAERRLLAVTEDLDRARAERESVADEIGSKGRRVEELRAEHDELEERTREARALLGSNVAASFERIKRTISEFREMTGDWSEMQAGELDIQRKHSVAVADVLSRIEKREESLVSTLAKFDGLAQLDARTMEVRATLVDAERRLAQTVSEMQALSDRLLAAKSSLEDVRVEREAVTASLATLRVERAGLELERDEVLRGTEIARGGLRELREERGTIEAEIRALRHERGIHEASIGEIKRSRADVIDAYRRSEMELSELASLIEKRRAETEEASERGRQIVERERERFTTELASLSSAVEAARQEREVLEKRNHVLAEHGDDLRAKLAELDGAREQARARHDEAVAKASDAERDTASRTSALEAVRSSLENLRAMLVTAKSQRDDAEAEYLRLQEERRTLAEENRVFEGKNDAERALSAELAHEAAENAAELGRLRVEREEMTARLASLTSQTATCEEERDRSQELIERMAQRREEIRGELQEAEKDRALRARSDLAELRELLRVKEVGERARLKKLREKYKADFKQLQDEWLLEENLGTTGPEFAKLRSEVEEQRHEVSKAERQLAAMRAGLSRLREENGRMLVKRMRSFEAQDLTELRRRLTEAKAETDVVKQEWDREMRGAESVERQWLAATEISSPEPQ